MYICFDNDDAGRAAAERVAQLIPHARVVRLPVDLGEGGDVTDFFVREGRSREEFIRLLEAAEPGPQSEDSSLVESFRIQPGTRDGGEVERVKCHIAIEEIVYRYVPLRRSGRALLGRCPFHDDRNPSFVVYPHTQSFYCFGCQAHGDVLSFLMRIENLTFPETLRVLRELTGEYERRHPTSS